MIQYLVSVTPSGFIIWAHAEVQPTHCSFYALIGGLTPCIFTETTVCSHLRAGIFEVFGKTKDWFVWR